MNPKPSGPVDIDFQPYDRPSLREELIIKGRRQGLLIGLALGVLIILWIF